MMASKDYREGLPLNPPLNVIGLVFLEEKTGLIKIVIRCDTCKTPVSIDWRGRDDEEGRCYACYDRLRRQGQ